MQILLYFAFFWNFMSYNCFAVLPNEDSDSNEIDSNESSTDNTSNDDTSSDDTSSDENENLMDEPTSAGIFLTF